MHKRHLLGWLAVVACCCAVLMTMGAVVLVGLPWWLAGRLGGDGMVAVDGWIVEAPPGEKSDITMKETKLDQPQEGAIENAWVELWTGDGKSLLYRQEPGLTKDGSFGVVEIGPYARGMRYLIKAGAPGYLPLEKTVRLSIGGDGALIRLAPAKVRPQSDQP